MTQKEARETINDLYGVTMRESLVYDGDQIRDAVRIADAAFVSLDTILGQLAAWVRNTRSEVSGMDISEDAKEQILSRVSVVQSYILEAGKRLSEAERRDFEEDEPNIVDELLDAARTAER